MDNLKMKMILEEESAYNLKDLIDSCNIPLDEISSKIKPLKDEIKSINTNLSSTYKNFEQIGKIAAHLFSGDVKQASNSIIKYGYKLANNMFQGQDFSKIFSGFRASGGNVGAGGAYVVGEKGPEIFMPHTSGNIVPNKNLSNGININVTMNINSSDFVSFKKNQSQVISEITSALRRSEKYL